MTIQQFEPTTFTSNADDVQTIVKYSTTASRTGSR